MLIKLSIVLFNAICGRVGRL